MNKGKSTYKRKKGKKPSLNRRATVLMAICLLVGFGVAIGRIVYLQTALGARLKKGAVSQQFSNVTISAKRGTIYDRNGKILAQSASVWKVAVDPSEFKTEEQKAYTSSKLAEILDLDEEKVLKRINATDSQYEVLKGQVEAEQREEILKLISESPKDSSENPLVPSRGINFYDDYKRYYPYGSMASALIGFTGSDDQGLSGLEYEYDSSLKGTPGRLVTAQNANGGSLPFEYKQNIEAEDGKGLVLTIDETIQSICEKYMKEAIIENKVYNRGGCIIMNPTNGEILADATVNGFDLNDPFTLSEEYVKKLESWTPSEQEIEDKVTNEQKESDYLNEMWRNKTVSDTYYPGSVFKMITASMALEEDLITEDSRFYCNGAYNVYGIDIHCHDSSGHGTQTFEEAICNSCNPALMQIGQLIGEETFWKYYQAFGFSTRTGVDMPGEAEDRFFSEDGSMGPVDLAVASFGQNFSITPMQMITAASAVANGGYIVQPHCVKEILDADGNVIETVDTTYKRQAVSSEVSKRMCGILENNAISGGAKNAYIAGYRVAGKTGTSEKKNDSNGDGIDDYISSFCGFAPADNAQVIMLVFFDTPLGEKHFGSQVAAPVFAKVMAEVLPYLEIERQYTQEELDSIELKAENFLGLTTDAAEQLALQKELNISVKGEGSVVVAQMPEAGSSIPSGGTVVLFTDEESKSKTVNVPDLVGLTLSEANARAAEYGVNISVTGSYNAEGSISVSQNIEYLTEVSPGTVVTVNFVNSSFSD